MRHFNLFCLMQMHSDICQAKMSSRVSWLLMTSVLSFHVAVRQLEL